MANVFAFAYLDIEERSINISRNLKSLFSMIASPTVTLLSTLFWSHPPVRGNIELSVPLCSPASR